MASKTKPSVGLDLGTTYSCISVYQNGVPTVIPNDQGSRTTPSVVQICTTGNIVGEAAKSTASANPKTTVFDAKRFIGRQFSECVGDAKSLGVKLVEGPNGRAAFLINDEIYLPEQISALVIGHMKSIAEKYLSQPVDEMVITVPAYFNDQQRLATRMAAELAGVKVNRMINEPTSSALAYGFGDHDAKERTILVFDLGGGTFDVSLLTVESDIFEVLATGGDTHLGGCDFDNAILDYCSQDIQKRTGRTIYEYSPRAITRLRAACEGAKKFLSAQTQATIFCEALLEGEDYSMVLTRAKMDAILEPFYRRCIDTVVSVLHDAGKTPDEISDVILVGGSSRLLKLQEMLSAYFGGKSLCCKVNPDEAVAIGACIQSRILCRDSQPRDSAIDAILLLDVCPLTIGLETGGGVMTPIITRNSTVPLTRKQNFSTYNDNQTAIRVRVFQGERPMTADNVMLGEFELHGIAPAPRGVPKIIIRADMDQNCILTITAQDASSGREEKIQISNQTALSADVVKKMIDDAEQWKQKDLALKDRLASRTDLENYMYSVRNTITDEAFDRKLLPEERKTLTSLVVETLDWLDVPALEAADFKTKKTAVEAIVNPIMIRVHTSALEQTAV
jgi:L1 cell adhesion molecule like protein